MAVLTLTSRRLFDAVGRAAGVDGRYRAAFDAHRARPGRALAAGGAVTLRPTPVVGPQFRLPEFLTAASPPRAR